MATEHSESTPPPHNAGAQPWPTYRRGGRRHPVSICLVPGIQAPDLMDADDMIHCGITGAREPLGPGIGTLFQNSINEPDDAFPISATVMRMGQRAIRHALLERLVQEAKHAQQALLRALAALQADDLDQYVPLCLEAEGMTCLLSVRTSWLTGIMAIVGGPEDPLLRHLPQPTRTEKPKATGRRTRRTR